MKSVSLTLFRIAPIALLIVCLVSSGVAATTHPLAYPYGLAVDSKGNLYVANANGNEVLVYSVSHTQVPAKTITQNISAPSGCV